MNLDWEAEVGRVDSLGAFCVSVGFVVNRESDVITPLKSGWP